MHADIRVCPPVVRALLIAMATQVASAITNLNISACSQIHQQVVTETTTGAGATEVGDKPTGESAGKIQFTITIEPLCASKLDQAARASIVVAADRQTVGSGSKL